MAANNGEVQVRSHRLDEARFGERLGGLDCRQRSRFTKPFGRAPHVSEAMSLH